ncbi:MAG: hypothetical protein MI746_12870 [Pseudomonadales bacterium]|nr:hypothetical protein [Pseudomonadales bacterium]
MLSTGHASHRNLIRYTTLAMGLSPFSPSILPRLLLLLLILATPTWSWSQDVQHLRFVESSIEWQGELQTAITRYSNPSGQTVDLIAAIHIGDANYYQALNDYFRELDFLLFELVADEEMLLAANSELDDRSALGFLQRMLAEFLELEFQLTGINYRASNFRHADLSASELQELMAEKDESFFSMFIEFATAQIAAERQALANDSLAPSTLSLATLVTALSTDNQSQALKYLLAQELGRTGGLVLSREIESELTILGDRNRVAMEVLQQTLSEDVEHIGLFYGAAHMPGLERALQELGFTRGPQQWLPAWTIR